MVKDLDIIYCKNCKNFECRVINKYSSVYSCRKESSMFDIDRPELYCNKSCYRPKLFKSRAKKKSSK